LAALSEVPLPRGGGCGEPAKQRPQGQGQGQRGGRRAFAREGHGAKGKRRLHTHRRRREGRPAAGVRPLLLLDQGPGPPSSAVNGWQTRPRAALTPASLRQNPAKASPRTAGRRARRAPIGRSKSGGAKPTGRDRERRRHGPSKGQSLGATAALEDGLPGSVTFAGHSVSFKQLSKSNPRSGVRAPIRMKGLRKKSAQPETEPECGFENRSTFRKEVKS